MREVFLVLPLLFKNGYRRKQGEKNNGLGAYLLFGIVMLAYSGMNFFNYVPVLSKINEIGKVAEYVASILLLATGAGAIFSISPMLSALYFSKDGEFFLRLPLKSSSVFIAKILYSYITSLFFAVVTCIVSLVGIGVLLSLSIVYYIAVLIGLLIVPFFGLLLAFIVCAPIVFITSLFKNRSSVSTIMMIFTYALIVAGYMIFVFSGGNSINENTAQNLVPMLDFVGKYAFPYMAISNISCLSSQTLFGSVDSVVVAVLINLAVVIVFFALVFALVFFIGKIFYNRGVSALLENAKTRKKSAKYKQRSQFSSFFDLEWKTLIRNPSFALSVIGPSIVLPITVIILAISLKSDFWGDFVWVVVYSMSCVVAMINMSACSAFSKEGARFYVYKAMPINKKSLVNAKLLFAWLLSAIPLIVSLTVSAIILQGQWWTYVSIIPTLVLLLGIVARDMYCDLKKPNLSWVNESDIVRSSSTALSSTFASLGIGLLVVIIPVAVYFVLIPQFAYLFTFLTVLAFGLMFAFIYIPTLYKKVQYYFEKHE